MKKTFFILLVIGLVLFLGACNTTTDDSPGGGGGGDVEWTVGYLLEFPDGDNYPGGEIDLAGRNLVDISNYASVTVNATLYTDKEGNTKATTPTGDNKNLAQFKLLKATGGWDETSNICGPSGNNTKYSMNVDGDTTWTVPDGSSGVPAKLLLQANWADFTEDGTKVKSIKVNSITFTAKTGAPVLDVVYDNGSYMTVEGNKITFNNAEYSHAAAIFVFPSSFPADLSGKKLEIKFTIDSHTHVPSGSNIEHQIHIQAANSDKQKFNGRNESPGQKYITLDSESETVWDGTGGTIEVALNDLLAAAAVTADANDCKGPFTLDAIRICNNGTVWEGHTRCKSYELVIVSVTVK
jgi:hypothetical protein